MRFRFDPVPHWPPNAWLARCETGADEVVVRHGNRVETTDDWFCEAAWPGPYEQGDFDRTDIVAGTGGRLRDGAVTFVSPDSTVDRLQFSRAENIVHVSNSLVCLIANLDIELDPCYPGYYADFRTITAGLDAYKRPVRTLRGDLQLCYFDNLVWDGTSLEPVGKPLPVRDLSSFEGYRTFLLATMAALVENGKSPARKAPYRTIGTLSSGYDSPTVAVVAKAAGNEEVITFANARGGADDSGEPVADKLGLRCITLERAAWRGNPFPEIPFLAANAYGEEMHFGGAAPYLPGRILFTGQYGMVWDKTVPSLGPEMARPDPGGLGLTEYRLWTGFLQCAVPYWAARELRRINAISNADEMRPWDVGGDYNRPICRRIVEEAGVPRGMFAREKRATAVVLWDRREPFLTDRSLEDYRDWLHRLSWRFLRQGRLPPLYLDRVSTARLALKRQVERLPSGIVSRLADLPGAWRVLSIKTPPLFYFLFPWAIQRAVERYHEASPAASEAR
ncbi:hypothetical protein [Rhodospirillaceae bacterium SYSU D60014]|uniref:hypothetical protein n=1 Tax=Virgifigura deserti TaxID=2268457 RepID=UPI000E66596A